MDLIEVLLVIGWKQIDIDVTVNRVIESNRQSFDEKENDILKRLLIGAGAGTSAPILPAVAAVTQLDPPRFGMRSTGIWQVKFGDEVVGASSLKDAYCKLLLLAHQGDGGFLERFSAHRSRLRRFVAQEPRELYESTPALAAKHATPLVSGWFADTNLSESQVGKRIRVAARVAGLAYGIEVWIRNRGRTI